MTSFDDPALSEFELNSLASGESVSVSHSSLLLESHVSALIGIKPAAETIENAPIALRSRVR